MQELSIGADQNEARKSGIIKAASELSALVADLVAFAKVAATQPNDADVKRDVTERIRKLVAASRVACGVEEQVRERGCVVFCAQTA